MYVCSEWGGAEGKGERESQADSTPSTEPARGLDPTVVFSYLSRNRELDAQPA